MSSLKSVCRENVRRKHVWSKRCLSRKCRGTICIIEQWNNTFQKLFLIIEGTHEKVSQFILPLESFTMKKNVLMKKVYFEHFINIETINNL